MFRKSRAISTLRQCRALSSTASGQQLPSFLLNTPETKMTTLDNGVRVATETSFGQTATIGVWIDAGSRYENEKNNGVAHFLEHMAFKGTAKRSQQQLEVEIENLGSHLNAYTSREQTVYYTKCLKENVAGSVELLSDILQNARLDRAAIDRERSVILREMEEILKIDEELIFDNLHDTAFLGSPLGRTILGPKENIESITREDLEEYIKTHYRGPRVVIAGAGAVSHEELVNLANEHFGNLPKEDPFAAITEKTPFIGSEIRVRDDPRRLAHVAIAFEGASWTSNETFPMMLMQQLLGSWERTSVTGINHGSLFCSTIAEKELAHSVMPFNTCYKDTGLFGIYTVSDPTTANDLMFYTMEALVGLGTDTNDEDLDRAKAQMKNALLSSLDGGSQIAEDIGRQILTYGRRLTPAEIFARIDDVDAKQVREVATKVIHDQDVAVSALGNIHEVPDYNWLRRRTYWLRL